MNVLTAEQRREMRRHEARLAKLEQDRDEARKAYAAWIHQTGVAAVARELGVPAGRLAQRVRLYEGKRRVR
jgi:DNA-binding ferritin-like protein (Dps family)